LKNRAPSFIYPLFGGQLKNRAPWGSNIGSKYGITALEEEDDRRGIHLCYVSKSWFTPSSFL